MSEGVSSSRQWSEQLPAFLFASWFALIPGALFPFFSLAFSLVPSGDGWVGLFGPIFVLYWFLALWTPYVAAYWVCLSLILAVKRRGNLGWRLTAQAIFLVCATLYEVYWLYQHPFDA